MSHYFILWERERGEQSNNFHRNVSFIDTKETTLICLPKLQFVPLVHGTHTYIVRHTYMCIVYNCRVSAAVAVLYKSIVKQKANETVV